MEAHLRLITKDEQAGTKAGPCRADARTGYIHPHLCCLGLYFGPTGFYITGNVAVVEVVVEGRGCLNAMVNMPNAS